MLMCLVMFVWLGLAALELWIHPRTVADDRPLVHTATASMQQHLWEILQDLEVCSPRLANTSSPLTVKIATESSVAQTTLNT